MNISGAIALVTGSNRGLGRAIVEALYAGGARRIYVSARQSERVDELCARDPDRLVRVELDICDPQQIEDAARRCHDVNLLVNNAGVNSYSGLLAAPALDGAQLEMATNYFGTLSMCRAFAPSLRQHGGVIVNVVSIAGRVNFPAIGTLSASKAALLSLCQGIRAELQPAGVRVVAVMPAVVDTDMARGVPLPKTPPDAVAAEILRAVENDDAEDVYPGDMAQGIAAGLAHDHKAIERQMAAHLP